MCGIGGLILTPPGPIKPEWMHAFFQDLAHRGPDDSGWLSLHRGKICQGRDVQHDLVAEMLLIHRRLSILDLTEAGHQPMGTPDGRYWIVFNGEIYNYVELREELRALGHRFRSHSDTEVLLAAYQQWGREALTRLVGMFAFAILDVQARRLFLARDFFGIKPLYYAFWQEGLAFASEIKPLLELPGVSRDVNPQRLYDYLCSGITDHGADTLFADIKQLPAAYYMEVPLDHSQAARPMRYWSINLAETSDLSFEEAAKQLRDLFLESVRLHLRSDVPVGAALSGGIDSSSIVGAMRLIDPKLEIHTFSYIADAPGISEERWVDIVGRAARVVVHKIKVTSDELVADLDHLIGVQGEPFGSTSMYAQWRVFQAARKAGIKVMLDGQGADELLGGYPNYRIAQISSFLRRGRLAPATELWRYTSTLPGNGFSSLLPRVIKLLVPTTLKNPLRRLLKQDTFPAWLNASWFHEHHVEDSSVSYAEGKEVLKHILYHTLTQTSLPQLLRYEDRNSMAFSIESRVPFLTPALSKLLLALPEHYIVAADGTSKAIFRHAMRGIVPDAILDRTDKLGFPTPETNWLLSIRPCVERVLKDRTGTQIHALNLREIQRIWEQVVNGSRQLDSHVWRWVNLILWVQKFSVRLD